MIGSIVPFVSSYDDIRAVCGLNNQELPDSTLGLTVYRNRLYAGLSGISGVYAPETTEQTLVEIWDRPLEDTDDLYSAIQVYSLYFVADCVLDSVGLRAYKTIADGKSSLTRFSPESTYKDTRDAVRTQLGQAAKKIGLLLGVSYEDLNFLSVVTPDVDLVLGE